MNVTLGARRALASAGFALPLFALAPLVAASASAASGAATAATAPRISFAEPAHDFGKVPQGQALLHTFQLTNSGGAVLQIEEVKPSCGCTTTGDWPHTLQPGESGAIPIKVETAHFAGPISKTIAVRSNDPAHPEVLLELKATVWTPVSIANPVLIFTAVTDPMQAGTRSTTIRSEVDTPLKLADVKSDNPRFRPVLKEVIPAKEYELTVTTVPPLGDGTQTGRITMQTGNEKMPEIAVQAVVTVLPAIQLAPSEFAFTTEKLAADEKRFAVVLNHRGLDIEVSDLTTTAPGVKLGSNWSADRKQFTVTLTFPAGFEIHKGERYFLRGKTNQLSLPTFEIPIVFAGGR